MATGNSKIHPVASKVLINKLKEVGKDLKPVTLNQDATKACFTNLQRVVTQAANFQFEAVTEFKNDPDNTTNLDVYDVSDHLEISWSGSPLELVIFILLTYHGDRNNSGKTHQMLDGNLE